MGGKKPLRRPLWPPTRATASNYYPLGLDGAGGAAKPLLRAPKKPAPLHGRLPAFSGAVDAFERARKCFLEWRYFFSIILSEFLKNRVALQGGGLEMRGSTQNPFFNRNVICEALCLTEKQVVIHPDTLGGSFGGKCEQISAMAVRAGIAALRLNRPVSYVFTREESIQQSHKRHGIRTHIRLGADHTGILTALEARAVMDGGAYVNESPIVTWKSTNCGAGPYRFPAVLFPVHVQTECIEFHVCKSLWKISERQLALHDLAFYQTALTPASILYAFRIAPVHPASPMTFRAFRTL